MVYVGGVCFVFSSRRRHTRLQGDWSSDVCSSDLTEMPEPKDINYYEVLQVSENADPDTLHRVFRIMAGRFYPDNPNTRDLRSEERRVGEEGRSRWGPRHLKKKKKIKITVRIRDIR